MPSKIAMKTAEKALNAALKELGFDLIKGKSSGATAFIGTNKELIETLSSVIMVIDMLFSVQVISAASVVDSKNDLAVVKKTLEKTVELLTYTTDKILNRIIDGKTTMKNLNQKEFEQWKKENAI